jgi:hypothetical protein
MSINLAHWAVTHTYIKASIEMRAMLDKQVHLNSVLRLLEIEKQKKRLQIGNYFAIFFCVAESFIYLL